MVLVGGVLFLFFIISFPSSVLPFISCALLTVFITFLTLSTLYCPPCLCPKLSFLLSLPLPSLLSLSLPCLPQYHFSSSFTLTLSHFTVHFFLYFFLPKLLYVILSMLIHMNQMNQLGQGCQSSPGMSGRIINTNE